jgi:hypothetical protein
MKILTAALRGALKQYLLYCGCWLDPHRAATLRPSFLFTRNALLRQRDRGRASPPALLLLQ